MNINIINIPLFKMPLLGSILSVELPEKFHENSISKIKQEKVIMKSNIISILVLMFILSILPPVSSAQEVTTGSLVRQMTDISHLVEYPDPKYHTIQFSSYDRRSDQPDGKGWYANSDGFGGEPIPNFEAVLETSEEDSIGTYLICDVDGPGAIVRGWTARLGGTLRVYLDESKEPIYEGPPERFLQRTYYPFLDGAKLDSTIFEETFRQRDAGYFPIPFSEHLRVEWTGNINNLHFYGLQVRKYEKEADVKTFRRKDIDRYRQQLVKSTNILNSPKESVVDSSSRKIKRISTDLPGNTEKEILSLEGKKAIYRLALNLEANNIEKALRKSILNIRFDEAPRGQVQVPVGDFFGAAPGINPYESLPFTVEKDGTMICRFVMPFKRSASIIIYNKDNQDIDINGSVYYKKYNWKPGESMYFHAYWRVNHNMNKNTPYDIPFINANGKGVYVGTSSFLFNPIEIPTSGGNWWGEGDEKIFVDDQRVPSIFGTGSEDYYNYSWSSSDIFQTPYSGQPRNDGPGNRGFVANHRWHILDPIPFQRSLDFYMELYPHTRKRGFSYARTSYLYGYPGLKIDHVPISNEDVRTVERNSWTPRAKGAASNAKFYQIENIVKTDSNTRVIDGNLYAEGQLLLWYPNDDNDVLRIPFKIDDKSNYRIWITAAKMHHSGEVSIQVDGKSVNFGNHDNIINLQAPIRKMLRNYHSSDIILDEGSHTVSIRPVRWESVERKVAIGLDFLWVQDREGD